MILCEQEGIYDVQQNAVLARFSALARELHVVLPVSFNGDSQMHCAVAVSEDEETCIILCPFLRYYFLT